MACYNLMEVEKTVEIVFEMLMSAEMDIFVSTAVIAPIDKDKWHVHVRCKSYTGFLTFFLSQNILVLNSEISRFASNVEREGK